MMALESLFVTALTVSISTTLVLIPLMFIAPLAKRRYPARWCCLLWLLVAVRLLVPFSIPLFEFSVQVTVPEEVAQPIFGAPVLPSVGQEVDAAVSNGGVLPGAVGSPQLSPLQIISILWLAGIAIYLIIQIVLYRRFAARVRKFALPAPPQTIHMLQKAASDR